MMLGHGIFVVHGHAVAYVHFNPVKHGYVASTVEWRIRPFIGKLRAEILRKDGARLRSQSMNAPGRRF